MHIKDIIIITLLVGTILTTCTIHATYVTLISVKPRTLGTYHNIAVQVVLSGESVDWSIVKCVGPSVDPRYVNFIVVDSRGVETPFWVEYCNASSRTIIMWIDVSTLVGNRTLSFYLVPLDRYVRNVPIPTAWIYNPSILGLDHISNFSSPGISLYRGFGIAGNTSLIKVESCDPGGGYIPLPYMLHISQSNGSLAYVLVFYTYRIDSGYDCPFTIVSLQPTTGMTYPRFAFNFLPSGESGNSTIMFIVGVNKEVKASQQVEKLEPDVWYRGVVLYTSGHMYGEVDRLYPTFESVGNISCTSPQDLELRYILIQGGRPYLVGFLAILRTVYPDPIVTVKPYSASMTVKLPDNSSIMLLNVTYRPSSTSVESSIVYSVNSSAVSIVHVGYSFGLLVKPYLNSTTLYPTSVLNVSGMLVSGSVSDLKSLDHVYMWFTSYNSSNTMTIIVNVNVSGLSWLVSDPRVEIRDIAIYVAGNLSKTVNAVAGIMVYNYTNQSWVGVSRDVLNQTTDVVKVIHLSSLFKNLRCLVSESGVISLSIVVVDVQTYPSQLVNLSLDMLRIVVTYVNASDGAVVHRVVISLPYGDSTVDKVVVYGRAIGDLLKSSASVEVSIGGWVGRYNISLGSTWVENVYNIDRSGGQLELTFRTYAESTSESSGEVLLNVTVYVHHMENIPITCRLTNTTYVECSGSVWIDLGDVGEVWKSIATVKVVRELRNVTFIGEGEYTLLNVGERYATYIINIYRTGTLRLESEIENTYRPGSWRVTTHGVDIPDSAVVGDVVCIDLPSPGNITITNMTESTHIYNTSRTCLRVNMSGIVYIVMSRVLPQDYSLGHAVRIVRFEYGNATIGLTCVNGTFRLGVEILVLHRGQVYTRVETSNGTTSIRLEAGNYTILVKYRGVTIGIADTSIDTLHPNAHVDVRLNAVELRDYEGSRVVMWSVGARLVDIEDLHHMYAVMRIVLNGSHGQPTCVASRYVVKPSHVEVLTNGTDMYYTWSGNTLIVCLHLTSPTYVETVDMYMLRIVTSDTLGRPIPATVAVDGREISGPAIEIPVTAYTDVTVRIPVEFRYGNYTFRLYGVNGTEVETSARYYVENVTVRDRDLTLAVTYRVPIRVHVRVLKYGVYVAFVGRVVDYLGRPLRNVTVLTAEVCRNGTVVDVDSETTDNYGDFATRIFRIYPTCNRFIIYTGGGAYETARTVVTVQQQQMQTTQPTPILPPQVLKWLPVVALATVGIAVIAVLCRKHAHVRQRRKMFKT